MKNLLVISLFLIILLISCQDLLENKKIIGNYYIISIDAPQDRCISYKRNDGSIDGLTNHCIVAIGYDTNFIIAKQHPEMETHIVDTNVTYYYIISLKLPVKKRYYEKENYVGPLPEKDYLLKRKELGVPDSLKFTMTFDDH